MLKLEIFLLLFFSNYSFSQKTVYSDECELIKEFLNTNDYIRHLPTDSAINLLDAEKFLSTCSIKTISGKYVRVIHTGQEIEKIKRESILGASPLRSNIVFVRTTVHGLTRFSIFIPSTGEAYNWIFTEQSRRYFFKKKSTGYF